MKKKLFFISIIASVTFAFCRGQNHAKHDLNMLYIVDQGGIKIYTDHLILLPKDIEVLNVLSKQEVLHYSVSSNYDVVFVVKPGVNVKLLNRQMLLDTFHVDKVQANFPIRVDGKLLTGSGDLLAEYAAISKMEVNAVNHDIEITTALRRSDRNGNEKIIY